MNSLYTAREATAADVPQFVSYLADHVRDNGVGNTPLFLPLARGTPPPPSTLERFRRGLDIAVREPGWVRLWLAFASERIVAHCDLSAPRGAHALHRTNLGMGVDSDHRRRGLAQRLMRRAVEWAQAEPSLVWLDLDVLSTNVPAQRLYERSGFELVATVRNAFVIDGDSVDRIMMTRRVG